MEFRILGPVEFWAGGQRHDLGWAQARLVLAIMLMNPERPISTESIIGKVWDDDPPSNARDLLYPVVRRLRVRLDEFRSDVRLVTHAGAYILETDPENIDYHRYRALHSKARSMAQLPDVESATRLYRVAASLWRGEPLSGLSGTWASRTRMTIEEVLLAGTVAQHEFELRHGRHADLVPTLADLTLRHPLNEKLVGLLMEALYRGGRQSEALAAFRDLRRRLVDAEGTDPGPELIALRDRILNADPSLLAGRRPPAESPPNNLPRDNKTFTGRTDELRRLIGGPAGHKGTTVITIDGMAGVGKTTLAIHAAHRLADAYPDGSLYLDLHGHSAEHESMEPATALARLLHYFGVLPARVPSGLDERAALWRTMVARRKVLILLDDASGHEQVSHLLPGGSSCLVIVTSRQRLTGLDGVRSVSLDVLPPKTARCCSAGSSDRIELCHRKMWPP
ncbi:BTAD domain-containing putative transcriptional regulator [Sphaerisporangium sp. B11E5]|uniref:AfsR/SARP family transcriptional regulator n=1 Tax=Sphaerisporangium sp. B11E5 TaxID=3153563 RepID=UPI00325DDCEA